MTNEKDQTVKAPQTQTDRPEAPQSVSIEQILSSYPIDRDKCRDVIMVEMSKSLIKIANSLEGITQGLIVANTHLAEMNALKK